MLGSATGKGRYIIVASIDENQNEDRKNASHHRTKKEHGEREMEKEQDKTLNLKRNRKTAFGAKL